MEWSDVVLLWVLPLVRRGYIATIIRNIIGKNNIQCQTRDFHPKWKKQVFISCLRFNVPYSVQWSHWDTMFLHCIVVTQYTPQAIPLCIVVTRSSFMTGGLIVKIYVKLSLSIVQRGQWGMIITRRQNLQPRKVYHYTRGESH